MVTKQTLVRRICGSRKLVVYRCHTASVPPELVWIWLLSCNAEDLAADFILTIVNHKDAKRNQSSVGETLLPLRDYMHV